MSSKSYPIHFSYSRLSAKISFGKYKGRTMKSIISIDPEYFKWLLTLPNVHLSDIIKSELSKQLWLGQ